MKKISMFFIIGTIGIILTSLLQIITTLVFSEKTIQIIYLFLYPVFIFFLIIGFWKLVTEKKSDD